ncbi:MAG: DUF4407 domain-containing protein [Verrucomicrobiota bacterium]
MSKSPALWLSGSGPDLLEECTRAEQRKHEAIGLSVLVPCVFALIAAGYAVSTLTKNVVVIVAVALAWSGIILLIDRSLLATYRNSLAPKWKMVQFTIRMTVAVLMGLTVSHPITLLLFKDTIRAQVEQEIADDIAEVRVEAADQKAIVEAKIQVTQAAIAQHRGDYRASYDADFLTEEKVGSPTGPAIRPVSKDESVQVQARIELHTSDLQQQLSSIRRERQEISNQLSTVQDEIAFWQTEYEQEINGQRSGTKGVGPRARSIEKDQLQWRREEAQRRKSQLLALTEQEAQAEDDIQEMAREVRREFADATRLRSERRQQEEQRLLELRTEARENQLASFVSTQDGVREQIQAQIDSGLADLQRLRGEVADIAATEQRRIDTMQREPRNDLLTQTLALHHLFGSGTEGGLFALFSYLILAGLFLAVDTIPILVKFTTKGGEYDEKLDQTHLEAAIEMLELRKAHMEAVHDETKKKLEGTRDIIQEEERLLQTRIALLERQIEVAKYEQVYRQQSGFGQRLPRSA